MRGGEWQAQDIAARPFGTPNHTKRDGSLAADYRIVGVVDLCWAIREGRPHRTNGDLALHVLEVLEGLERSAATGQHVTIESRCERPAALGPGSGEEVFATRPIAIDRRTPERSLHA